MPALTARRVAWAATVGLCLVPVVRMAGLVASGSPLQYSDYWLLVDEYTNADGGLRLGGLVDFDAQNHPVVLPMLVYWLDFQLFAGSNRALGALVVLLGVAIVVAIALIARRCPAPLAARVTIVVLSAYLVFSPNGAWNYVKSMSGTAWLGANLVTLVAIHLRARDRLVGSAALAAVAVVTYATGLMAWVGVLVTGLCRRPVRSWWREWPAVVGFAVSYRFYQEAQRTGLGADPPLLPLDDIVRGTAGLFGLPLGLDGDLATAVGLAAIVGIGGFVIWALLRAPSPDAAPWAGIATFGVTASATLAVGRPFVEEAQRNRYTSLPALALVGLAGLAAVALAPRSPRTDGVDAPVPRWAPFVAVSAVLVVLAAMAGREHVAEMRRQVHQQELREVALRLDLADGTRVLAGLDTASVTDLLRTNGQYPFVDGWDLDCGLLGDDVAVQGEDASPVAAGVVTGARLVERAVELTGRLEDPDDVRCVVVAGDDGVVIGAGTLGYADGKRIRDGFVALAPADEAVYSVLAVGDDGRARLVGTVGAIDVPGAGEGGEEVR